MTLTKSWGDRTCSVVVIWTRRNWHLAEHQCCDKTRERRRQARGENTWGEKTRGGRKHARGEHTRRGENTSGEKTREVRKHATREKRREEFSRLLFHSCVSSVPRSVLSRAACSVVSAFVERHAYSRSTEDRRYFKFQITAHCKFNLKHHIKHAEDYHRRQSWAPGVETLDFTIRICSKSTFLYFDLYLNCTA